MKIRSPASALVVAAIAALIAGALFDLRGTHAGLGSAVAAAMDASGVVHPVTAVLLNFRSYDTWLELIVLLVATMGALQGRFQTPALETRLARDPLTLYLVIAIVPLVVLAAGYLLKAGAYAPGGAFQAGALLAAGLVLLHLTGRKTLAVLPEALVRGSLVAGAAAFAIAAATGLAYEQALLAYPPAHAAAAILAIEAAAMVSIAVSLAALVIGQLEP